jgi:hypothetical protein
VTKNNDALISQGFIFLYRIEERYRHDICKHTYKRSMYPHAQTSPQSFNPPKTTDLCLSLLVTPRSTRLICCCGADLGQLGLLRHIPHTARAKDVSAQLTGCNWSPEHDLDMGIHILMRQFFHDARQNPLSHGWCIDQSAHHVSISLGSKETSQCSQEERSMSSSDFPNSLQTGRHRITA